MTIFDSLRYPVSNEMSMDEFRKIPVEIREAWVNHADYENRYIDNTAKMRDLSEKNMMLLQRIISEWP